MPVNENNLGNGTEYASKESVDELCNENCVT